MSEYDDADEPGADEREAQQRWIALGVRTDIPHPARVYVDNDRVVFRHAQARTAGDENIAVVPADLRDVDGVLAQAGKLLDFGQPVGLMFVAVLHNITDADDPAAIAARGTWPRSRPVVTW